MRPEATVALKHTVSALLVTASKLNDVTVVPLDASDTFKVPAEVTVGTVRKVTGVGTTALAVVEFRAWPCPNRVAAPPGEAFVTL